MSKEMFDDNLLLMELHDKYGGEGLMLAKLFTLFTPQGTDSECGGAYL